MKKLTQLFLCMVMALGMCLFSTNSISAKVDVKIISHEVFLTDEDADGDYKEYLIVYYSKSDNLLRAVQDECVFYKDKGYSKDALESKGADIIESVYPGFKDLSFGSWEVIEEKDTVSLVILFNDLTNAKNLRQMYDADLIVPEDKNDDGSRGVDAPYFMESIEKNGGKKLSLIDYDKAGVHFSDKVK
jgi:hypothetical protein